jgi:hypothetical protein
MQPSDASGDLDFRKTPPETEADVLLEAVQMLRNRLPRNWSLYEEPEPELPKDIGVDARLRLRAPDGTESLVLVGAKRLLNSRDVPSVLESLREAAARLDPSEPVMLLLASRYLPETTQERIAEAGAGYADATGNLMLLSDRPGLFLRDRGAERDPWRGPGRPLGTLRGPPAARVVRALIDFAPPYTVPELSTRARASTGATYRVVEFVEGEGLLERARYGPIGEVQWRRLLERWSKDYGFAQSNTVTTYLEPRGLGALTARLAEQPQLDYVLTGSLAAARVAAYAESRLAMLYVRDAMKVAKILGLRSTDSGANVALASGKYDVAFERPEEVGGLRMAASSQAAVDLLSGPGRNPSEASALLDWMERNEPAWRR